MVDSAIFFATWPNPEAERPTESFLDFHKLRGQVLFFGISCRVDISHHFYKATSAIKQLKISQRLSHVGTTTYCVNAEMSGQNHKLPYAIFSIKAILVDPQHRKPIAFPEWWKNKYAKTVKQAMPPRMERLVKPKEGISCLRLPVVHSDTDIYHHTNWVTYIRACNDAFIDGTLQNVYDRTRREDVGKDVKYFEIGFKRESKIGEKLDIYSWKSCSDSGKENGEICFEINKGSEVCCQAKMGFHGDCSKVYVLSSKL